MTTPTVVGLLHELATTPDLPAAACRDHLDVFDAVLEPGAAAKVAYPLAVEICAGCRELASCRAWRDSLPPGKVPYGVTAGMIRRHR
jgi:hypothetical protein